MNKAKAIFFTKNTLLHYRFALTKLNYLTSSYYCNIIMSKKHTARPDGLVFSTNQDYMNDYPEEQAMETLPKNQQKLKVKLDTKQRAGKVVTLVDGFVGTHDDMESLGKQLKTKCGTGGSVKDGYIIIQGDYKEKITGWLKDMGYLQTK
jgi:translation initiation factor 1